MFFLKSSFFQNLVYQSLREKRKRERERERERERKRETDRERERERERERNIILFKVLYNKRWIQNFAKSDRRLIFARFYFYFC